ncbi:MAG: acyloxyacyl hydrolase [Phycisphaerae bacterium]|nr:acyloxyacyl hydrolase [Phycisphaerae bacterium]
MHRVIPAVMVVAAGVARAQEGGMAVALPRMGVEYLRPPPADEAASGREVPMSLVRGEAEPAPPSPEAARAAFGTEGTQWWTFGGGVAHNLNDATDYNLRVAYSMFLVDRVEFSLELNAWYFDQRGDNAFGINPAMVIRMHFVRTERWTAYVDPGIGLLFASDVVPDEGTGFEFMPRVGVGVTYGLTEDPGGPRLQAGIRWHHISNARIEGDIDNPSRDGAMVYVGVMVPY